MNLGSNRRNALALFIAPVLMQFVFPVSAQTPIGEHWIPTWVTAQQSGRPVQMAGIPPQNAPKPFDNQTLRMVVHTSIPGRRARVELSNAYGLHALHVGAVHIALRAKDSAIVPGSDRALTFSGKPTCSLPPGGIMISDPVDLDVPQLGDLLVSLYLPSPTDPDTDHGNGLHATYIKEGDVTGQASLPDATKRLSYFFLSSVDVLAPPDAAAAVAFGDSITDGTRSTPETDSAWPSVLAQRMIGNMATSKIAVLNQGIAGNRINRGALGDAGLTRFDRDALVQPGVQWVILMMGLNDIGAGLGDAFVFAPRPNAPANEVATPDDLIVGYKQFIDRAHMHGVKVMGGTLTPFEGAAYYTEKGNVTREAVNEWIRTSHAFDAVVDFDAIVRSPSNLKAIKSEYDGGDHLHFSDAGYKAMANSIDLSFFTNAKASKRSK